ncbi:hypothetical protein ACNR9Q_03045 [Maribacter sp. X9]
MKDCVLYTRYEPCAMCLGVIFWFKFQKIYYGASAQQE